MNSPLEGEGTGSGPFLVVSRCFPFLHAVSVETPSRVPAFVGSRLVSFACVQSTLWIVLWKGDERSPLPLTCCETIFSEGSGLEISAFPIEICLIRLRLWWDFLFDEPEYQPTYLYPCLVLRSCAKSPTKSFQARTVCVGVD